MFVGSTNLAGHAADHFGKVFFKGLALGPIGG